MPEPDSRSWPAWAVRLLGVALVAMAVALPSAAALSDVLRAESKERLSQGGTLRPRLVQLPGGTFMMGSPEEEGRDDEHPQHAVRVSAFAMCETEVTVGQYLAVIGEVPNDCNYGCEDEHPVLWVNWKDAFRYLNTLTQLENRTRPTDDQLTECYHSETLAWDRTCTGYRLPTEAEWEYAARAGSTTMYSFGDEPSEICEHGHVEGCAGDSSVVTVKARRPNAWGMYGIHGNAAELIFDKHDDEFYARSPMGDPLNDLSFNALRVLDYRGVRGGSFFWGPIAARSAARSSQTSLRRKDVGFRCARGSLPG